jgi:aspartate oxidase
MPSPRSRAPVQADFLIIGSGVAGLRAALELSRAGRVIVLTKGHSLQSSSIHAQGGVAVAMSEEDDVTVHLSDTIKAGHGLCRKEAVRVLVEEGPERIQELIKWGAKFDKVGRIVFNDWTITLPSISSSTPDVAAEPLYWTKDLVGSLCYRLVGSC